MMPHAANILGDSDLSGALKLLFGLAFLIIWGISAMVSWSKKSRGQQQSKQPSWQEILRDLQGGGAEGEGSGTGGRYSGGSQAQRPYQESRPAPGPVPPPIPQRPQKPPRKSSRARPTPVPAFQAAPMVPESAEAPGITSTAQVRAELPAISQPRKSIAGQLLTGKNLRQQFILMELLRPPVTLRDDQH